MTEQAKISRNSFENWLMDTMNIDIIGASYGIQGDEDKPRYALSDDPYADSSIFVTAMFYAWQAGRQDLCTEINEGIRSAGSIEHTGESNETI